MERCLSIHTSNNVAAFAVAFVVLCASCTDKEKVTSARPVNTDYIEADATVGVRLDSTCCLIGIDGRVIGTGKLTGKPLTPYNGVFPCWNGYEFNVYSISDVTTKLNAEGFAGITDFRTGYAYAYRKNGALMVVNTRGAVVRVLQSRIVEVMTAKYQTKDNISATYRTDDGHTGIMRPNGEIIIEFDEGQVSGFLNDDRIPVYIPTAGKLRVVDSRGKEIFAIDGSPILTSSMYSAGWYPISRIKDGKQISEFIDTDGNVAMTMPDGMLAIERLGNIAVTTSDNGKYFTLTNVETNQTVCDSVTTYQPVPGSDLKNITIVRQGRLSIVDIDGKKVSNLAAGFKPTAMPFGNIVPGRDNKSMTKLFNFVTGQPVSDTEYLTVATNDILSITSPKVEVTKVAQSITDCFERDGVNINNFLYTSATTIDRIVENSARPLVNVASTLEQMYRAGNRSITLDLGNDNTAMFTFDTKPVVTETQSYSFFGHVFETSSSKINPSSHLQTLTKVYDIDNDEAAVLVPSAVDYLVDHRGFARISDVPNAVSNGTYNVIFVTTRNKVFVTASFTHINYDRLKTYLSDTTIATATPADNIVFEVQTDTIPTFDLGAWYGLFKRKNFN